MLPLHHYRGSNSSAFMLLIPTPGQTEQEFLAGRMMEKKWFYSMSQKDLNLPKAFQSLEEYNAPVFDQTDAIQKTVAAVLQKVEEEAS